MAEAMFHQKDCVITTTAAAAVSSGEVRQLPDGRAAVYTGLNSAASGDPIGNQTEGVFLVAKTSSIVFLDGGRVYWDASASKAHFKKVNDRDYYIGRAVGDAASGDTQMYVNLNVPECQYDWTHVTHGYLSVPTGTQAVGAFGYPKVLGATRELELTSTNEAQCIDMLSKERFAIESNPILEAIVCVVANGSTSAVDFNVGLANGTSTTDADAITEHVLFHIDGGDLSIFGQSKDGTTTVAAADSTVDVVAGSAVANKVELWIDARDTSNVKLYVDGVRVISGSTFKLNAGTGPIGALAHLEKTSSAATGKVHVDFLAIRTQE